MAYSGELCGSQCKILTSKLGVVYYDIDDQSQNSYDSVSETGSTALWYRLPVTYLLQLQNLENNGSLCMLVQ